MVVEFEQDGMNYDNRINGIICWKSGDGKYADTSGSRISTDMFGLGSDSIPLLVAPLVMIPLTARRILDVRLLVCDSEPAEEAGGETIVVERFSSGVACTFFTSISGAVPPCSNEDSC